MVVVLCRYYCYLVCALIFFFESELEELFVSAPKDELHQFYLGLFGDHIVPAVFYRYTQVLRRADLVNSKEKPLITAARL